MSLALQVGPMLLKCCWDKCKSAKMLLGDSGERERKDEERERQIKREAAGRDGYICISFCIHENNHNPLIE